VDLKDWRFAVHPREEWKQMFAEAWRLERDYFYDQGMHAWTGRHPQKIRTALQRVTDRDNWLT